jgi:hypothetical protein
MLLITVTVLDAQSPLIYCQFGLDQAYGKSAAHGSSQAVMIGPV